MKLNNPISRKEWTLLGCISGFIACLLISSVTASKLWFFDLPVLNYRIVIPVGTSLFAITFLCTDVIAEVWGKSYSVAVVWLGFFARLLMLGFFSFAVNVTPVDFWENQEAYASILQGSTRIIIAGIIAYLVSQMNDVFVFHHFKQKDAGKNLLWKRNNLSTFCSQFLDSFLFIVLAFAGSASLAQIISMITGQVIIKWGIAIIDTPFLYLIRNFATEKRWNDFSG